MTVGFYGGKFLPLHNGHVRMIYECTKMVDKLYVVLSSSPKRDVELCERDGCKLTPAFIRLSWLGETISAMDNVEIIHVLDNQGDDDYDWEEGSNNIKQAIPEVITHVFSSEPKYSEYFDLYYPEAEHVVIDADRSIIPISATEIRKNVYTNWDYLPDYVRAYYVKKVAIVGTESCGKSTLTEKLAKYYDTNFVPEIGRYYCENYSNQLTYYHFDSIAMDHFRATELMIKDSNKLLFIDSEAVTTQYYLNLYKPGMTSNLINAIIARQEFDLVLYLEPDVAWIDDGYRFAGDEDVRRENNKKLKNMFVKVNLEYIIIKGNYDERFNKACQLVNDLME